MTGPIPELRAIASRRGLGVIAAGLLCIGCAAPVAPASEAPTDSTEPLPSATAASTPSASATLVAEEPAASAEAGPTSAPDPSLVMRVEQQGGLMAPDAYHSMFPAFTLLGDARVILPGAPAGMFIGRALPAAKVRQLSESGMETVLDAVADSGQFEADAQWWGASSYLADAGATFFTLNVDGGTVTVSFYALGFGAHLPDGLSDLPADELARTTR